MAKQSRQNPYLVLTSQSCVINSGAKFEFSPMRYGEGGEIDWSTNIAVMDAGRLHREIRVKIDKITTRLLDPGHGHQAIWEICCHGTNVRTNSKQTITMHFFNTRDEITDWNSHCPPHLRIFDTRE